MKLVFASFQGINLGNPKGMVKFLLPLFERFSQNSETKYYVGDIIGRTEPNIVVVSAAFWWFKKSIAVLVKLVPIKYLQWRRRFILELAYDYLLAIRIQEPVILVTSAYVKRTFDKNEKLGGINYFVAGNPDDNAIHQILLEEMGAKKCILQDPYTDKSRILRIAESINKVHRLFLFTSSQLDTYGVGLNKDKIIYSEAFVKPNLSEFIDTSIQKNDVFTFCYVAHTVWLKGLTYLIEAWHQADVHDAKLRIAGTIDSAVLKFINDNYSEIKNVEFMGAVPDLNSFLRSSHITVVPSLLDAGPATVAESLYCGTPVVCTDGCGSKSLIKNNNGLVVEARSVAALADGLRESYNNYSMFDVNTDELSKTIQSNGVEQFYSKIISHVIEPKIF